MKKAYIEPVMIVEDFTVSEMVAANCGIIVNKLNVVTYTNNSMPCDNGTEDYWSQQLPGAPKGVTRGTVYANFTDLYDGTTDFIADNNSSDVDYLFTKAYHIKSENSAEICSTDPLEFGVTFGNVGPLQHDCNSDTALLQNS